VMSAVSVGIYKGIVSFYYNIFHPQTTVVA